MRGQPTVVVADRSRGPLRALTAVLLFALCARASIGGAEPLDNSRTVLRFDAGPRGSIIEAGATALYPNTAYSQQTRFGWTREPTGGFTQPDLSRSRTALTSDGVVGNRLAWRADLAPGDWHVTLWLESAGDGPATLHLIIQGQRQQLGWQKFAPPAEPRQRPPKTYRVFHAVVQVGTKGLSLELTGTGQSARLLGISLIRRSASLQPAHHDFLAQLRSAGRHDSSDSLHVLAEHAEKKLLEQPTATIYAAWHERLAMLMEAERLFQMRGWASSDEASGLGMFDRLYQAVMLVDGLLGGEESPMQPLAERACYLRGRILYWLHRERAGEAEQNGARRDLGSLYAAHPHDKTLAMYNGQRIDLSDACDCLEASAEAPAWSVAEREALCRMRQIAHWWLRQQRDNGEFGGKLGDDVELLRWWAPLVLSGDKLAQAGWEKLANGVWSSKHVHEGYAAKISDVEHAAEFVADTAPLLAITSDAACYQDRLALSTKHFHTLWTDITPQGHRFFRSAWFSSTGIDEMPPKARDLEYNTRAVQAMRYLAWRRPDRQLTEHLHQWSTAWVSAAMRTDKGKPRGIIPASVRFADEAINGDEPTWYLPNLYWDYYQWQHHAGSLMLDQLLLTFSLTKDEQLLQPLWQTLALIRSEEAALALATHNLLEAGSPTWAAAKLLHCELFWNVAEQWRFMTDDSRWDDLILRHGTPYGRYRLSGNEAYLVQGLNQLLEGVRYNTPLLTTEVVHTDRVSVPRAELLKAMLTGDGVQNNLSPYFAVSWEETDENFTALVSETGIDRLTLKLYSHAPAERTAVMRIWQLLPGEYRLRQETVSNSLPQRDRGRQQKIKVHGKGERIPIRLPAGREIIIRLTRNRES